MRLPLANKARRRFVQSTSSFCISNVEKGKHLVALICRSCYQWWNIDNSTPHYNQFCQRATAFLGADPGEISKALSEDHCEEPIGHSGVTQTWQHIETPRIVRQRGSRKVRDKPLLANGGSQHAYALNNIRAPVVELPECRGPR